MMESALSSIYLSLIVASCATVIIAILGLAVAYALARYEFAGKGLADALITIPMILPPTVVGYYLIIVFGNHGIIGQPLHELTGFSFVFTWYGAVVASVIVALPLMVKTSRAAIEAIDKELINVSQSLGKSEWETFLKVILPIAKGGIMAGIVLAFARAMGEFGATLMLAGNIPGKTSTMPLAIYSAFQGGDDTTAQILVIILTGFSVFVIYIANKLSKSRWL
jgi:molybdate transport system permease protein